MSEEPKRGWATSIGLAIIVCLCIRQIQEEARRAFPRKDAVVESAAEQITDPVAAVVGGPACAGRLHTPTISTAVKR